MCRKIMQGFTIIELFVIIVIIAILALLFFTFIAPFMIRHGDYTEPSCINNQRQLCLALIAYAQDNDQTLPLPSNWVAATGLTATKAIFHCPSSTSLATPSNPDYGYNAYLYNLVARESSWEQTGVTLKQITNPSTVECTTDLNAPTSSITGEKNSFGYGWNNPFPGSYTITALCAPSAALRHAGGIVISYLDGHVSYKSAAYTASGSGPYNIGPGVNRFYIDFSQYTGAHAAAHAQHDLNAMWMANGKPIGGRLTKHNTYILPKNTRLIENTSGSSVSACGAMFGITYSAQNHAKNDLLLSQNVIANGNYTQGRWLEICLGGRGYDDSTVATSYANYDTGPFVRFGQTYYPVVPASTPQFQYGLLASPWAGIQYSPSDLSSASSLTLSAFISYSSPPKNVDAGHKPTLSFANSVLNRANPYVVVPPSSTPPVASCFASAFPLHATLTGVGMKGVYKYDGYGIGNSQRAQPLIWQVTGSDIYIDELFSSY